jgi:hypothetical protein
MADRHRGTLSLRVLGVNVRIQCEEARTQALLKAHYGWMQWPLDTADLTYTIARQNGTWLFAGDREELWRASDAGEVLLGLDQDLIIQLQRRRSDLYFIHAGVLEFSGKAFMLVAPSGGGKSTLVWGLVHHGLRYLSDELAPVDLRTLTVHPYPRAVTLKSVPPRPYPLPRGTLSTSRGFHVTAATLASGSRATTAPVAAICFLRYTPEALRPSIERISAAQAGARLYANALNALAHPEEGLDGAIHIARTTACFDVATAELAATCALVKATWERLLRS